MAISEGEGRLWDYLKGRKQDYQLATQQPAIQRVLADLAIFCRATETCVIPGDEHMTWILEGRREVWLRIQEHLHLTTQQLYALRTGKQFNPGEDNG